MKQDGIDISQHASNNINEYLGIDFSFIITVCDNAKERCTNFPSRAKKFHQNFPDPAKASGSDKKITQCFIEVRDMIKNYCKSFAVDNLQ